MKFKMDYRIATMVLAAALVAVLAYFIAVPYITQWHNADAMVTVAMLTKANGGLAYGTGGDTLVCQMASALK